MGNAEYVCPVAIPKENHADDPEHPVAVSVTLFEVMSDADGALGIAPTKGIMNSITRSA